MKIIEIKREIEQENELIENFNHLLKSSPQKRLEINYLREFLSAVLKTDSQSTPIVIGENLLNALSYLKPNQSKFFRDLNPEFWYCQLTENLSHLESPLVIRLNAEGNLEATFLVEKEQHKLVALSLFELLFLIKKELNGLTVEKSNIKKRMIVKKEEN